MIAKRRALFCFASLLAALASIRCVQVIVSRVGGGQHLRSPNERYEAWAGNFYSKRFFGGERQWYEFRIIRPPGGRVHGQYIVEPSNDQPTFDMRDGKAILWAIDSTEVTFRFGPNSVTLKSEP